MHHDRFLSLFALLMGWIALSFGEAEQPPPIGNFSLPPSQQVSVFFSFGDFLVDQGQVQTYLFFDDFKGPCKSIKDIEPFIVYGITDNLSILGVVPFAIYREDDQRSGGFEDMNFQVEWAFYNGSSKTFLDQLTVVFNVSFPSGSLDKDPPTGAGSPGYFLGLTAQRTTIEWLFFTNYGIQFYPSFHPNRVGNQYLYEYGLGRLIATWDGWIFSWLLEIDGTYSEQNRIEGVLDENSGGNLVLFVPSFWLSSKNIIIQFGVGFPLYQSEEANQPPTHSVFGGNLSWTF